MNCVDLTKVTDKYIKLVSDKLYTEKKLEKNESVVDMMYYDALYLESKKTTHDDIIKKMNIILRHFSYDEKTEYMCFNKYHVNITPSDEIVWCPFSNKINNHRCKNHKIMITNIKQNKKFEYNYLLHHLIKEHYFFWLLNPEDIIGVLELD